MIRKTLTVALAVTSILIGLYPFIYFVVDRKFGLLQSKSETLLANVVWNTAFYTHIIFGGLALLIGWTQFDSKLRTGKPKLHRNIGKLYIISVFASALTGIYIAMYATGGIIASLGFAGLGVVWFFTTLKAYLNIRNGNIDAHEKMMIYSYACCFAAVTLRIYLPILSYAFQDFTKAYLLISWLCWVPNLIVAYLIIKNIEKRRATASVKTAEAELIY